MKKALVTGDVALDVNIYHGKRARPWTQEGPGTETVKTPGGAFLLHDIIASISLSGRSADLGPRFETLSGLPESLRTDLSEWSNLHGYCLWEEKKGPKEKEADGKERETQVWRLDRPLGYGGSHDAPGVFVEMKPETRAAADLYVLDDGNLGFRSLSASQMWPQPVRGKGIRSPRWIVLKMSDPLCEGDLWRACRDHHGARTIALVNLEDIRSEEVRVTKGISWERTALDLVGELEENAVLAPLKVLRYLIVRIGFEGALVVRRGPGKKKSFSLIFDAEHMEGDWGADIKGTGMGFMSTLTAGVVSRLAIDLEEEEKTKNEGKEGYKPEERDRDKDDHDAVIHGVKAGLLGMRTLLEKGHREVGSKEAQGFPFQEVAAAMASDEVKGGFAEVSVPVMADGDGGGWSFLAGAPGSTLSSRPVYGHARCLALKGPGGLKSVVPYQSFGKMLTMDRAEIESLRNLRQLILDYEKNDKGKKPLSLAVFGPPGSGKSFGIKQIAEGILGKKVPLPEFNLSQFNEPGDLIGALHQVRDLVLKGTTPVVFWDEFDSKGYFWLQYLLAPMQDGAFQEGQVSHPIGKCIFVFAGGTSWDYENFGPPKPDKDKDKDNLETYEKEMKAWATFKLLKGPDFLSRLSGYLNVLGPNPRCEWKADKEDWIPQPSDICFPLRRAILLRAMLGLDENELLDMDPGLLSAFLEIPKYEHGARSLEKILEQVKQRGKGGRLRRSDLPPAALLELHADFDEFMRIAERDQEFMKYAESLAPAFHKVWYDSEVKKGNTPDMPEKYDDLPSASKADNIAPALRMPKILKLAGLSLVAGEVASAESAAAIEEILEEKIELLAEAEHDGWMSYKYRNGWEFNRKRDNALLRHNLLIPYTQLSEEEKDKDRDSVRNYPTIAKGAGYRIVTKLPV
ncbi:MAG: RyR domain-containing protein [Pseudomonadota bacterium]